MLKTYIANLPGLFSIIILLFSSVTFGDQNAEDAYIDYAGKNAQLPEFLLFDDDFKPLRKEALSGHWTLIYFGYLHCPDVCPTTLQTLANAIREMKQAGIRKPPQVWFVSVDPWRDRPENIRQYVEYFDQDFIGASADAPQLNVLTNFFKVIYYNNRSEQNKSDYEVAHSDQVMLINPQAEFVGAFKSPLDSHAIAQKLLEIIR